MSLTVDRPPVQNSDVPSAGSVPSNPAPDRVPVPPRRHPRSFVQRYKEHLWVGGVSLVIIAVAVSPLLIAYHGSQGPAEPPISTPAASAPSLSTTLSITASEFKFSPTAFQVPVGQKIQLTLTNTGQVEHDVTIPAASFSLQAKPGESASGTFNIDTPGVFDFICSIPGHKDAGMKGTVSVVDGSGTVPVAAATHDMAGMSSSTSASSV